MRWLERAQLESAAIYLSHAIDGIEHVGAKCVGRPLGLVLEACHERIESGVHVDRQIRRAERLRSRHDVDRELIVAVGYAGQIELEDLRRLSEVATYAIDGVPLF